MDMVAWSAVNALARQHTLKSAPAPRAAATEGSIHMAVALPRYMPLVVTDTLRARSCGGIHCRMRGDEGPWGDQGPWYATCT